MAAVLVVAATVASLFAGCGSNSSSTPSGPDDVVLPVIVGLRRDDAGLAADTLKRSSPSEATYRQWLSPAEITARFGAPPDQAKAALAVLTEAGFTGAIDPTGGLLVGTMRASDAARFFKTDIVQVTVGAAGVVVLPAKPVEIPKSLAAYATEIVGLIAGTDRDTTTTVPPPADPPPTDPAPGDPSCPPAKGLGPLLRTHYGMQPLIDAGGTGKGVRIAMVEVSPTSQQALRVFAACRPRVKFPPVNVINVDGSSPEVFDSRAVEATLDIIAAALVAPSLGAIDVYQVNPYSPVAVSLAAVAASADGPNGLPHLISLSLGFCEKQLTDAEIATSERVLMGLAAMGTSVIASTGDFGSSSCAPDDLSEAVEYPASSQWVVGVGGTSFVVADGKITDEVAWGANGYGGGGGRTSRIARPSWQADIGLPGTARVVPDVAFLADPANIGPIPLCDTAGVCVWEVDGGTSATAPGAAAGTALILSYLAEPDGTPLRLGALNPGLYAVARNRAAAGDSSGGYIDIVSGSNDVHGVGCCSATPGYDAVTGLGAMDFYDLAQRLKAVVARSQS